MTTEQKRTIFPKKMFSTTHNALPVQSKIESAIPFWTAIATKNELYHTVSVFIYFMMPDNTAIYEWFRVQEPISKLYDFVAYFLGKEREFDLKVTGEVLDRNNIINDIKKNRKYGNNRNSSCKSLNFTRILMLNLLAYTQSYVYNI